MGTSTLVLRTQSEAVGSAHEGDVCRATLGFSNSKLLGSHFFPGRWAMTLPASRKSGMDSPQASGGDGISVELFQILKDDAVEVLHTQYGNKFGKLSGHRTRKGQFSFQSQSKAMPKNVQTSAQLHSSHMLVKKCSNSASQTSAVHEP